MGVFEDFLVNAKEVVTKVSDKCSDTYDVAKLRVNQRKIATEIDKRMQLMGNKYYRACKAAKLSALDLSEDVEAVDELYIQYDNLSQQIAKAKNQVKCPVCGEFSDRSDVYCSKCGGSLK